MPYDPMLSRSFCIAVEERVAQTANRAKAEDWWNELLVSAKYFMDPTILQEVQHQHEAPCDVMIGYMERHDRHYFGPFEWL